MNRMDEIQFFADKNNLEKRWRDLKSNGSSFTIAETEFNFGNNFLPCIDLWHETTTKDSHLHYISGLSTLPSIEYLETLRKQNYSKTVSSDDLINLFPPNIDGVHTLFFLEGRVKLSLLLGNTVELFGELIKSTQTDTDDKSIPTIDACFVRESEKSSKELWTLLALLSSKETTFAALTKLVSTRKNAENAGFRIKSETTNQIGWFSLSGQYSLPKPLTILRDRQLLWHINGNQKNTSRRSEVIVLGAGIAGCTVAASLARRGYKVKIVDRHASPCREGSGNHRSVVYPRISLQPDPHPRINLRAIIHASRYYQPFWNSNIGSRCGVLVLPRDKKSEEEYRSICSNLFHGNNLLHLLEGRDMENVCGIRLAAKCGMLFPNLGLISPSDVCQQLINSNNIELIQGQVDRLAFNEKEAVWSLIDETDRTVTTAKILVLAASYGCLNFEQTNFLPVKKLHGQISHLPATNESDRLKTIICGHGYVTPAHENWHSCGATYNNDIHSLSLRTQDTESNIEKIMGTDPALRELFTGISAEDANGWAHFRCTTPDYLPILGPVPIPSRITENFKTLQTNARASVRKTGIYRQNLYIHCGLGSKGMSYAPLTAELLASEIANEIPSFEEKLRLAMHPARFLIRDLKKRRLEKGSSLKRAGQSFVKAPAK